MSRLDSYRLPPDCVVWKGGPELALIESELAAQFEDFGAGVGLEFHGMP